MPCHFVLGISFDVNKAVSRAIGGGLSGAAAMVVQVFTLMPMRTIMNVQYRNGGTFKYVFSYHFPPFFPYIFVL
jgi:hypothetical protein